MTTSSPIIDWTWQDLGDAAKLPAKATPFASCAHCLQGDACIHALYAPGRLYFLKRTDAPKEEAEAIRKVGSMPYFMRSLCVVKNEPV